MVCSIFTQIEVFFRAHNIMICCSSVINEIHIIANTGQYNWYKKLIIITETVKRLFIVAIVLEWPEYTFIQSSLCLSRFFFCLG